MSSRSSTAPDRSPAPPLHVPDARPRLDVCLVAHLAYGALAGTPGHIGGVEYQTSLLARWLAARGHRVQMITWDEGQGDVAVHGVHVVRLCRRDAGWPIVRFLHPRWSSLVDALARADAQLYYQNCGESATGQVALWCRARGRRFVFSSASNADCDRRLPLLDARRERVLYRLGLARADRIIVQTPVQREMMRGHFGYEATVIPMPVEDRGRPLESSERRRHHRVAWIGRLSEVKRPDRLLDLADACPDLTFDLVGPEDGSVYARDVVEAARRRANVVVHGALSRDDVAARLAEAAVLCNTSDIEGFPNTFLEAWSHAVPVISHFDPDGIVARARLGWIVTSTADMAARLTSVLDTSAPGDSDTSLEPSWAEASANARRHYERHHTVDAVMPQFEALFLDVLGAAS